MIVNYDLSDRPTTFDFAAFCVFAKTCGATHVHFQLDGPIEDLKYPAEVAWKRFGNIVLPITKLARMSWDIGSGSKGEVLPRAVHTFGNICNAFRTKGHIALLKPTQTNDMDGVPYVTITLRESFKSRSRNSNRREWAKFKETVQKDGFKVVVLDECENRPLDVEWRFALYCGAAMNFGVISGPIALCTLSKAPYIALKMGVGVAPDEGFPKGSQAPWAHKHQKLVWEEDTYENIRGAWEAS